MINSDNLPYYRFTGPQRLEKAVRSLEGLLEGMSADRATNEHESAFVAAWLKEYGELSNRHPFNELFPKLADSLSKSSFDPEEAADMLWLCSRMKLESPYFDEVASDIQRLHGILGGVASDGIVTMEELDSLVEWIDQHKHLASCWPYDELESLLLAIRSDGRIDAGEHKLLLAFFSEFICLGNHRSLGLPMNEAATSLVGMCAVCPQVNFSKKLFCFTGASKKASRKKFQMIVEERGGTFSERVTRDLDYLVIGADGNPCWTYSCYGRKVEQAVGYRRDGCRMLIVHEHDFWDAVAS